MRGLTRLLFMFGPMILREFQKYQRRKERERHQQPQRPEYEPRNRRDREYERPSRKKQTPPPPPEPKISEEEKNFKMKEDEFMLDKETLNDYKENKNVMGDVVTDDVPMPKAEDDIIIDDAQSKTTGVVNDAPDNSDDDIDSDLDLKDIFFKDDDDD